jgi:hypothetical protein
VYRKRDRDVELAGPVAVPAGHHRRLDDARRGMRRMKSTQIASEKLMLPRNVKRMAW